MTEIFRCLAGSRLYGTNTADSDRDYKAVHLPTKRQILLGKRTLITSQSTGSKETRNDADDVDVESFELQRYLQLAADMQTIPVELLFIETDPLQLILENWVWDRIVQNRDKILNNNSKAFVGYCKGQAVRYSMRGKRLETYEAVVALLAMYANSNGTIKKVADIASALEDIDGVEST